MSSDAYQNALAKKSRLLKELEEVNGFLRLYQKFAPKAPAASEVQQAPGKDSVEGVSTTEARYPITSDVPIPPKRESVPERYAPIIEGIILEKDRPIPRREMLTALAAKGYPVPGTDPSKNLGTIMWRLQDKFVNINGHGFWIRGKAYLPANYTGESSTDLLE